MRYKGSQEWEAEQAASPLGTAVLVLWKGGRRAPMIAEGILSVESVQHLGVRITGHPFTRDTVAALPGVEEEAWGPLNAPLSVPLLSSTAEPLVCAHHSHSCHVCPSPACAASVEPVSSDLSWGSVHGFAHHSHECRVTLFKTKARSAHSNLKVWKVGGTGGGERNKRG